MAVQAGFVMGGSLSLDGKRFHGAFHEPQGAEVFQCQDGIGLLQEFFLHAEAG